MCHFIKGITQTGVGRVKGTQKMLRPPEMSDNENYFSQVWREA